MGVARDGAAAPSPRESILGRVVYGLPVVLWGALASNLCMLVGWHWDISWHRSIGRDTVWTLPHIFIYAALLIAFAYNSFLILSHTFGSSKSVPGIRIFGFNGPSGAFVTLWAILLQFTAIVFDNWWHGVYGLDVAVFSPPHALLGWGITFYYLGQFMLAVLYRNSVPASDTPSLWIALVLWAFQIGHQAIAVDPSYGYQSVRNLAFVTTSATAFPICLVLIHVYLRSRWAATISSGLYMVAIIVLMQLFQFFPAHPQFGPVYHQLSTFLPPLFPLVLVVPAAVLDTILFRWRGKKSFGFCLLLSVAFVFFFNVTNWLVAAFLRTPRAANRFFAAHLPSTAFEMVPRTAPQVGLNAETAVSILIAVALAFFTVWIADRAGEWLRRLSR
jgi:hypothetical protein